MKKVLFLMSLLLLITGCNSQLKTTVDTLQSEVDTSKTQLEEKAEEIKALKEQVLTLEDTIQEKEELMNEKEEQIQQLESSSSKDLEKELNEVKQQLLDKEQEVTTLQSEIKELLPYKETVEAAQNSQNEQAENIDNPITIEITEFTSVAGDSYLKVEGELKNISDLSLRFVQLRATFTDADGNIIDSSQTFAQSRTLLPNAMTKFSTSVTYDSRIENVEVELIDYKTE